MGSRDYPQRRFHFLDRAKGIPGALDKDASGAKFWKKGGAQLCRLSGGMKRIGEQKERLREFGLVGGQEARLPAAVGNPAKDNPAAYDVAQRCNRQSKPGAIPNGLGWPRRSGTPLLTEWQIAAQHGHARGLQGSSDRQKQWRVTIASSPVRQHRAIFLAVARPVQESANARGFKRGEGCERHGKSG
jgi:hypothetical protein